MDNIPASSMIALLPMTSEWCKIEPAHLTMAYIGDIENLQISYFNDLAKAAASISMITNPISVKVLGLDVFGEQEKVNVLRLESTQELLSIRSLLEEFDTSEHPFNPHCTIGPIGVPVENVPMFLTFDRISVWWGEKTIPFWLKRF